MLAHPLLSWSFTMKEKEKLTENKSWLFLKRGETQLMTEGRGVMDWERVKLLGNHLIDSENNILDELVRHEVQRGGRIREGRESSF